MQDIIYKLKTQKSKIKTTTKILKNNHICEELRAGSFEFNLEH